MANRFFVGSGTNWSSTSSWAATSGGASGASVPLATDDVFLDASSPGNLTIDAGAVCQSLNCTGFTHALTHTAAVTLLIGSSAAGASNIALKLVAGMTYTLGDSLTSAISFVSTSATVQSVDTGGKTLGNFTLTGVGGSWQLVAGMILSTLGVLTVSNGTFDTNGQTCSWGYLSSSNSNVRTITLGASVITITGSSGQHWDFGANTNLTFNAGTSAITLNPTSTWAFNGGGKTFNNVTINLFGGYGNQQFSGSNTFANLTINANTGNYNWFTPQNGKTQTITGTLTISGNTQYKRIWVSSDSPGNATTLNAAAVVLQNADFMDVTATGAATWNGTLIGDGGGNTGITFTTPLTLFRVGAGGSWTDANWSLTSGGTTGQRFPLLQDTVFIDANASGNLTSGQLTTRSPIGKNIDFTGFAGSYGFGGLGQLTVMGNMTLATGITMGGNESLYFAGRGSFTISCKGKTFGSTIVIAAPTGTYTLSDAFATTGQFDNQYGTLNTNNQTVSCGSFTGNSTGGPRTFILGTSVITLTGTSGNAVAMSASNTTMSAANATFVIGVTSVSSRTFAGANYSYGTLTYTIAGSTGALVITGANTFGTINFSDVTNVRTITFPSSNTTIITTAFNVNGTTGKLMTVNSSTSGTAATLSYTGGGLINCDFLSVKDSTPIQALIWFAGHNSTAVSNTGNWQFGTGFTQGLTGAGSFAGAMARKNGLPLTATVAFTGAMGRSIAHVLNGVLSSTGAINRRVSHTFTAGLSYAGTVARRAAHAFTGSIGFAGAFSRRGGKAMTGSIGYSGQIGRAIAHTLTAALSFAGLLPHAPHAAQLSLTAGLSYSGSVAKRSSRSLLGYFNLAPAGTNQGGSLADSYMGQTYLGQGYTGSINLGFVKLPIKGLNANLSYTGLFGNRNVFHVMTAVLSYTGSMPRRITRSLAGASMGFAGGLVANVHHFLSFTAAIAPAGQISRQVGKVVGAALSPVGSAAKRTGRAFTAAVGFSGLFVHLPIKNFMVSLSFTTGMNHYIRKFMSSKLSVKVRLVARRHTRVGRGEAKIIDPDAFNKDINIGL